MKQAPKTSHLLLERARDLDDQDAWSRIEALYGADILRQGAREGLSATDAEDLRQLVLLRLTQVIPKFQYRVEGGSFRGYLRVMVRRVASRLRRITNADVVRVGLSSEPEAHDDSCRWDQQWLLAHLDRAMGRVAASVHPRSLDIIRRYLSGQSSIRIAQGLGMSVDAVRKVRQRMRTRLAAQIQEQRHREARHGEGSNGPCD